MSLGKDWDADIVIPDGWFDLHVEALNETELIAAEVDQRLAAQPELRQYRDHLVDLLASVSENAFQRGAFIGAMFWNAGPHAVVTAVLMVFEGERQAPGSAEREIEVSVAALTEPAEGAVGQADVRVVELPAGTAVRSRQLRETTGEGGSLVLDNVQYWVPSAEVADALAVLSFSTPNLAVGDEMAEIFDDIALTFVFHYPEPATGP